MDLKRIAVATTVAACLAMASSAASASALGVTWMKGFSAPGTPGKFNKVGVIKVGPATAKNVLVLMPGTSAGSAYFVPFAQWLVSKQRGWQVWSVERRENLLEDHSVLNGRPGAADLAGLVYDDGASGPAESASAATQALQQLASTPSPWLSFGGIPAPFAGIFNATGALGSLQAPNAPSLGMKFPLLPANLKPPIPVTNLAQYGFALNVGTSPRSLIAAQAHLGRGVSSRTIHGFHTWDGRGALTPIKRFATMFAGPGMLSVDGTEWYFPQRLADDTLAVGNGIANPAQSVLGVPATLGRRLPHRLLIYAFGAALGGPLVPAAAVQLAKQSHIPMRNLTLFNRQTTYAHNDPVGAFPRNVFFTNLVKFLRKVDRKR